MMGGRNEKYHRSNASSIQLYLSGVASWPEGLLGGRVRVFVCLHT